MTLTSFMAFNDEFKTLAIGELTIENKVDKVSFYGSVDITKDKAGLAKALKLKRIIDSAIDEMKRDKNLPDHIEIKESDTVENPFEADSLTMATSL